MAYTVPDDLKKKLKKAARLMARVELGTYKGQDSVHTMKEYMGNSTGIAQGTSGDGSLVNFLDDFKEVVNRGLTGGDLKQGGFGDKQNRLGDVATNRKRIADVFNSPKFLDKTFAGLEEDNPDREKNTSEYLEYLSETFGIDPAESRKRGAKGQHIVDTFNQRRAENEERNKEIIAKLTQAGRGKRMSEEGEPFGKTTLLPGTARTYDAETGRVIEDAPPQGGLPAPELVGGSNRDPAPTRGIAIPLGQGNEPEAQAGKIKLPESLAPKKEKEEEEKEKDLFGKLISPIKTAFGGLLEGWDRGAKAVSTGLYYANQNKASGEDGFFKIGNEDDWFRGIADSITGKKGPDGKPVRVSWSEALDPNRYQGSGQTVSIKNKSTRAVVGFAGDVATDPLTGLTFGAGGALKTGFKATTGIVGREAAVKTAGAKAFSEAMQVNPNAAFQSVLKAGGVKDEAIATIMKAATPKTGKVVQSAVNEALEAAVKAVPHLAGKAGVTATKVARKNAENAAKRAQYLYALEAKKAAENLAFKQTQKKVQAKMYGVNIPGLSSVTAYNAMYRAGQKLAETRMGQGVNQLFRTSTYLPGETKAIANRFMNVGYGNWEDTDKMIRNNLLNDITPDEAKLITHSIENGTDLNGVMGKNGADLGVAKQKAQDMLADMWDAENALGIYAGKSPKQNYVHHTYLGGKKSQQQAFKQKLKALGSEKPGFAQTQLIPTLEDAKKAGLKPVEDIRDILSIRAGKSHQVRARAQFVQTVADEYGVKLSKGQAKKLGFESHGSEFLPSDIYFPPEIVTALKGVEAIHTKDEALSALVRNLDKVTNTWKLLVTGANPAFHIRGLQGDTYLNFMAGVTTPKPYMRAARILSQEGGQGTYRIGHRNWTGDELFNEFKLSGGRSSFGVAELPNRASSIMLPKKFVSGVRNISETRENFTRLSHFLDKLEKYGKNVKDPNDLRVAALKATGDVEKFNFNYLDLTPTERNTFKRVIPFYTFMRKNLPLQIESAFLRPGKLATKAKSFNAIETMLGTDQMDKPSVELGADVPDWAKEVVEEELAQGEVVRTGPGAYYAPRLPTEELSQLSHTVTGENKNENIGTWLMQQMNPVPKAAIELSLGKQARGNRVIYDRGRYTEQLQPSVMRALLASINPSMSPEDKKAQLRKLLYSGFDAERYRETE